MNAFLDTSVLVPVFLGDREQHAASMKVFAQCPRKDSCRGAHSLAEVYATRARLPGKHRVGGEQAMLFIGDVRARLSIVALDDQADTSVLQSAAALKVMGGAIYDAILAGRALEADARTIDTWNVRHSQQLGPEVARRLRTPPPASPPGRGNGGSVGLG